MCFLIKVGFVDSEHLQIQVFKRQDESDMGMFADFSRVALIEA